MAALASASNGGRRRNVLQRVKAPQLKLDDIKVTVARVNPAAPPRVGQQVLLDTEYYKSCTQLPEGMLAASEYTYFCLINYSDRSVHVNVGGVDDSDWRAYHDSSPDDWNNCRPDGLVDYPLMDGTELLPDESRCFKLDPYFEDDEFGKGASPFELTFSPVANAAGRPFPKSKTRIMDVKDAANFYYGPHEELGDGIFSYRFQGRVAPNPSVNYMNLILRDPKVSAREWLRNVAVRPAVTCPRYSISPVLSPPQHSSNRSPTCPTLSLNSRPTILAPS